MKKTILEIKEMSDSKEVYGQRPNPFIAIFIYCLVGLLTIAIIYSCFGKIEIVATASGLVRPNDDVNTLSSLIGGRVTGVFYTNGQVVQAGDKLLTIDTSEMEITLNSLESAQTDYKMQIAMFDKFLDGIDDGANPFSADMDSDEYPYYVQYRDYELSIQNSSNSFNYDTSTTNANISAIDQQIVVLQNRILGLNAYKASVQQGKNLASDYPEHESMYLSYNTSVQALTTEYQAQKEKIELDGTASSNQYYIDYYQNQLSEYNYLIRSIEGGRSVFPSGNVSDCKLLYNNYVYNLDEYQRKYDSTKEIYEYYLNGGSAGGNASELLAYDYTMLEGYTYYKQSVENDQDMFSDTKDSVFYKSLYNKYRESYDALLSDVTLAREAYDTALNNPGSTEAEISAALEDKDIAEAACANYKTSTIVEINNAILQIEASIAEKAISIGSASSGFNTTTAIIQMENAEAAISAYKTQALTEYKQMQSDLKNKINELQMTAASTQDKASLLTELERSYQNSIDQQYYQAITQIDTTVRTLQAELNSAQSNLRLYQLTKDMYGKNVDENGDPLTISIATIEELSSILTRQETLANQLDETQTQIQQATEQISQGTITAEMSGVINTVSTVVRGDALSSGTVIATIIPFNESEYKVQMYVSNADIGNMELGDRIRYNLAALPNNQYGTVEGSVTSISSDTLIQDDQYSGYFLVEGNIENAELTDKDGNKGSIAIGMQLEEKIVTQEKSILRYLLEKINLF